MFMIVLVPTQIIRLLLPPLAGCGKITHGPKGDVKETIRDMMCSDVRAKFILRSPIGDWEARAVPPPLSMLLNYR